MMRFKVCPKCRGNLYQTQDRFGSFLSCMQCGYLKDIERVQSEPAFGAPGGVEAGGGNGAQGTKEETKEYGVA